MTVQNDSNVKTYTGNGVTTVFPYDFFIPGDTATDQSNVEVTLLEIATGVEGAPLAEILWSITGVNTDAYGNVTYTGGGTPLPATHKINIRRVLPYEQNLDLTTQSAYFPQLLEEQLDLIVYQIQQLAEEAGRSVKVGVGSDQTPDELIDSLVDAAADAEAAASTAAAAAAAADAAVIAAEAAQAAAEAAAASINPADLLTISGNPTLVGIEALNLVQGDILYATAADTLARLAKGTALQQLRMNAGATAPEWATGGKGPDVILEDQKTSGTNGGTFTSGAHQVRTLNTEVYDPLGLCSLASNQFTLPAGTYAIEYETPSFRAGYCQAWLYNVTAGAVVGRSTVQSSDSAAGSGATNIGRSVVTVAGSTVFEIRFQGSITRATDGLGTAVSLGTEVYTRVAITKVA